jgi:hypothetical protein
VTLGVGVAGAVSAEFTVTVEDADDVLLSVIVALSVISNSNR